MTGDFLKIIKGRELNVSATNETFTNSIFDYSTIRSFDHSIIRPFDHSTSLFHVLPQLPAKFFLFEFYNPHVLVRH